MQVRVQADLSHTLKVCCSGQALCYDVFENVTNVPFVKYHEEHKYKMGGLKVFIQGKIFFSLTKMFKIKLIFGFFSDFHPYYTCGWIQIDKYLQVLAKDSLRKFSPLLIA